MVAQPVVFNREFVIYFATRTRVYGILDSGYLNDFQLLQEGFPEGALHERFHSDTYNNNRV
jgi:hypothetical protein